MNKHRSWLNTLALAISIACLIPFFSAATASSSLATASSSLASVSNGLASAPGAASARSNSKLKFHSGTRGVGIAAPLLDAGDYYYHPNGRKIKFLRKQGVYRVRTKVSAGKARSARVADSAMQSLRQQFAGQLNVVKRHRLGDADIVRIKNSAANTPGRRSRSAGVHSLQAAAPSIAELQPVLANAKGQGDILVTPKLIVKLAPHPDLEQNLSAISKRYGLRLIRKIKVPGHVYSLAFNNPPADSSQIFVLVRQVMSDARVAWAQPQFRSKPYKHSYEPDDPLFDQQWNLRNSGLAGSRCDTDCDANNAWGLDIDAPAGADQGVGSVSANGMVIAVIDDGVQLDHEDLRIWENAAEIAGVADVDDDGNGYVDDINGYDFVDDDAGETGYCADDGSVGPDADPSPQADAGCVAASGVEFAEDDHGTAVAGIAAAKGDNGLGVAGAAYSASVLPIRLISDYDTDQNDDFCARAAEAMIYAGRYADVVNNSWGVDEGTCPLLEDAIDDVLTGTIMDDAVNVSKRPGLGSPVLFASGNNASGWVKVTIPVSAGTHSYEWRFLRSDDPDGFDEFDESDSAWVDDITWPDGSTENFETGLPSEFTSDIILNEQCNDVCTFFLDDARPQWEIDSRRNHTPESESPGASQAVGIDTFSADCGNSYLFTQRTGPEGELSFWIWVETDLQEFSDKVEFLLDGVEQLSFGDIPTIVNNQVGYPASLSATGTEPGVIAVGASNSGDLSGDTAVSLSAESRSPYSQFGASLDVLAPSNGQHLAIYTTDRYGSDGEGLNDSRDLGLVITDSEYRYTDNFGGTSAATPLVAGIAAAVLAVDGSLTAAEVRELIRATSDKVGLEQDSYLDDGNGDTRSEFYGYGRVNMYQALQAADGVAMPAAPVASCASPQAFSYTPQQDLLLPNYAPQEDGFCPAVGRVPDNSLCVAIRSVNNRVATICL